MPYHAIILQGLGEKVRRLSTLQPVEVGVAGLLVLVFLLVEGSPEGAGRVVRRSRGSVAVGYSRGPVVVCGVAAAVARLLVLQTSAKSNMSQLSKQIRCQTLSFSL